MSCKYYTADFETTIGEYTDECCVWLWAIYDGVNVTHGSSISSFFYHLANNEKYKNSKIYFHNLKFDGMFLLYFILNNDIAYSTSISDMGVWYSIKLTEYNITILDSFKRLCCAVADIPRNFDIAYNKQNIFYGDYSYSLYNLLYIDSDVRLVYDAITIQISQGLVKDTRASNALHLYKQTINNFKNLFPRINTDDDLFIREAYYGGYTYVDKPGVHGIGSVYDVNSMYAWAMRCNPFPYSYPIITKLPIDGMLHITKYIIDARLKAGGIPTIPAKRKSLNTKYINDTEGNIIVTLTDMDFNNVLINYDIYYCELLKVYNFKYKEGMFDNYIDAHYDGKKNATTAYERQLHKDALCSLYGKFGAAPTFTHKLPRLNMEGKISYTLSKPDNVNPVYLPVAVFVTAYAREKLFQAIYANRDNFIYCDTDSVHLKTTDPPSIEVHHDKLGAWKLESVFSRAKFLRPKTYIEVINNRLKVTVAGLPKLCHTQVTFDNFKIGAEYTGKLLPKQKSGGVVLQETTFIIK